MDHEGLFNIFETSQQAYHLSPDGKIVPSDAYYRAEVDAFEEGERGKTPPSK